MENKRAGYTREECCQMLLDAYISLGRYPKKSDFTPEQVGWIKSYLGPWPRALEACGILLTGLRSGLRQRSISA
ncbi:homing endonuclease associated repeat-containing protein [Coprococcus sp. OM06-25]|uniref:homing endonuclease associated repeat-containing protein n=1 Tax=Coprococcus sp. OM06-25 TaxID=2293094 RepID=UPI000E5C6DBB|nr:hypothetical protein [Coprococcus sp. OM06-25]RGI42301.1 hypothetical protein DXB88_06730 [Coprococcus sp. OM06-25]